MSDLRESFERDGYVVLPRFLSADELAELSARTEAYLDRGNYRELMKKRSVFQGILKNLNVDDGWFADLLQNGRPAQTVKQLLGDEVDPATAAYFDRIPGEKQAVAPHFDAIGHRRKGATLWIALDKASKENGCLYYAKGTHNEKYDHQVGLPNFDETTPGAQAIELEPGDAAVHSSLTVHWSNPNRSQRSRRGVTFFYWAASSEGEGKKKVWDMK